MLWIVRILLLPEKEHCYLNTTKDLLIQFPVSGTGYDYQYRNMGETQNKGIEATLNWTAIDKKNFGLSFSANIGFNKNKIKDLGIMTDFGAETYWASSEIGYDFWIAKGGAVGKMYGYRSAGRYEVSDFEGYDATSKKWILKDTISAKHPPSLNFNPSSAFTRINGTGFVVCAVNGAPVS